MRSWSRPTDSSTGLMTSSDDAFPDGTLPQGPPAEPFRVLGRDDHGPHRHRPIALVFHRDLGLAVGPEPVQPGKALLATADLGQPAGDLVRQGDRHRHPLPGLPGGVAEHHPLVPGPLLVVVALVHAPGDVRRLPVDRADHRTGTGIEAERGVGVADPRDRGPHDVGDVHVGRGADLAGHDGHAGGDQGLAGHAAVGVLRQNGVEDGVGDLVGELVGMALGDGLRGEDVRLELGHVVGWPGFRVSTAAVPHGGARAAGAA